MKGFNSNDSFLQKIRELTHIVKPEEQNITRVITEIITDGIIIVNSQGIIIYTSSFANQMFGYEENELIGNPIEVLVPIEFRRDHFKKVTNFIKTKQYRRMSENQVLEGVRKNNERIKVKIKLGPIKFLDQEGAIAVISHVQG